MSQELIFKKKKRENLSSFHIFLLREESFRIITLIELSFSKKLSGFLVQMDLKRQAWTKRKTKNALNRACSQWSDIEEKDKQPQVLDFSGVY